MKGTSPMLIVKISRENYKNRLPSGDFNSKETPQNIPGIVYQKGNSIFVSPLLERYQLNHQLERNKDIFPLLKYKDGSYHTAIAFDRTLVFQADEFLKYIKEPALLLPIDYHEMKDSQYLIKDKLFSYVSDFLAAPNHERFKDSTLHEFKEELEEMDAKEHEGSSQNSLPFFDVDTKEEYDFIAKNVDPSRIAKKDIQEFGEAKKPTLNAHDNLEMEM